MAIKVYPHLSPRLIIVSGTEITMQELTNVVMDWEDDPWNMTYPRLIKSSGKQDLGGGVSVGITTELQNARIAFEARTTSTVSGTCTTSDSNGIRLIDSGALFITNGVEAGATIINFIDKSVTTVITVNSETEIIAELLEDGINNQWEVGDTYKIWNVEQCMATGGNLVAVDSDDSSIEPIYPTAFTQVIRTSASSATLQELEAIQYSSFNGGVTIDTINGTAGILYPLGTKEYPVNPPSQPWSIFSLLMFSSINCEEGK